MSKPYTVENYVIECRRTGGPWMTWSPADPARMPDEKVARKMFVTAQATRHDPAGQMGGCTIHRWAQRKRVLAQQPRLRPGPDRICFSVK
jgi:hypothetical protein